MDEPGTGLIATFLASGLFRGRCPGARGQGTAGKRNRVLLALGVLVFAAACKEAPPPKTPPVPVEVDVPLLRGLLTVRLYKQLLNCLKNLPNKQDKT